MAYVKAALETYPDITILATSEVAGRFQDGRMVLDSGITEDDIEQAVADTLDIHGAGFIEQFWGAFNPIVPLMLIAAMQARSVLINKQTVTNAAEEAVARGGRAVISTGAGAVVICFDGGLLSIPAAVFAGWYWDRYRTRGDLMLVLTRQCDVLRLRAQFHSKLLAGT
ncbi:MAG: hypothetical protein ACREVE_04110 [Gammaproteobacteria bacterium]